MSMITFKAKLNRMLQHSFKTPHGKVLDKKMMSINDIEKIAIAAYQDGYDDCITMYEPRKKNEQ